MRKILLALTGAAALLAMAAPASASVLFNSTFDGLQAYGTWNVHATADGWTAVAGPGIELQNHVAGDPSTGAATDVFVELDSHANSAMSRTITDEGNYVLDFLYSPRPGVGDLSNGISIFLNGNLLDPPGNLSAVGGGNTMWSAYSTSFHATAGSILTFAATGTNDSLGGYVDNIKLSTGAVPEPATWAMMIFGFGGVGAAIRRRRQQPALAAA